MGRIQYPQGCEGGEALFVPRGQSLGSSPAKRRGAAHGKRFKRKLALRPDSLALLSARLVQGQAVWEAAPLRQCS